MVQPICRGIYKIFTKIEIPANLSSILILFVLPIPDKYIYTRTV